MTPWLRVLFAPYALPLVAFVTAVTTSAVLSACGPNHIRSNTPRERHYEPGDYARSGEPVSAGSLWTQNSTGLSEDFRARNVGDLVTVIIDETISADSDAATDTSREADTALPGLLGLAGAIARAAPDGFDPAALVDMMANHEFDGSGSTSRGGRARGTIAVRVKQRLPNNDLFIEGTKVILINQEELHIYISGVIRPEDIEQDNSISSSLLADAQIEFSGRGTLSDNQRQGWLRRLLNKVRPM